MKTPLSLLIVCHGRLAESEPFVDALREEFLGSEPGQGYTASDYELLDPLDFRVFTCPDPTADPRRAILKPDAVKQRLAEQSEAVLIMLLLAAADAMAEELIAEWADRIASWDHGFLLVISLATPTRPNLPSEERMAALGLDDLNERDLRRDLLALHALNRTLALLARRGSSQDRDEAAGRGENAKPKLFISHAKRDGVPLAVSIRSWIKSLPGFAFFYDTDDLNLSGDISAQLEQAVSGSILIVLRTEIFDQRYWCQKEIYWAEKHGVPVLAVDGRWSLQHPPSVIVFDSSPSVRIPDGSIVRILMAAMSEALRVAFFRARVRIAAEESGLSPARWTTVPRFPSLGALHSATGSLTVDNCDQTNDSKCYIVHPNPALPDGLREVAADMAAGRLSCCKVLSLDEFRLVP